MKKSVYNYQSEAPNRIKSVMPPSNHLSSKGPTDFGVMKASNVFEDGQKSDFTFVLSNPTDFLCDCTDNQNNNSFIQ